MGAVQRGSQRDLAAPCPCASSVPAPACPDCCWQGRAVPAQAGEQQLLHCSTAPSAIALQSLFRVPSALQTQ